jgi:hypothetical protein
MAAEKRTFKAEPLPALRKWVTVNSKAYPLAHGTPG